MLDMDIIRQIDEISIELRKVLGLPINRQQAENFEQISFDVLSQKIQEKMKHIEIRNDYHSNRSYVVRKSNDSEEFIISVGLDMVSSKRIDCLMHELAHILIHKDYIKVDNPKWKNAEPWDQEDEANCLSRAFLMPKDYFMYALVKFSKNDGSVDIDKISAYFEVQDRLVIERGRDLLIWN